MFGNEALTKTLRLHALLADGTDATQQAVDERSIALDRFSWPLNVTKVRLQGRCGDTMPTSNRAAGPVAASSGVTPAL